MRSRLLLLLALLFGLSTVVACTPRRGNSRGGGDDDDDDDDSAVSDDDDAADDDDTANDDDAADDDDTGGPAVPYSAPVGGLMQVFGLGEYTCTGALEMDVSDGTASGSASCDFIEPAPLSCIWSFSDVPVNGTGEVTLDCMESTSVITLSNLKGDIIEGTADWTDNTNLLLYMEFRAFPDQ